MKIKVILIIIIVIVLGILGFKISKYNPFFLNCKAKGYYEIGTPYDWSDQKFLNTSIRPVIHDNILYIVFSYTDNKKNIIIKEIKLKYSSKNIVVTLDKEISENSKEDSLILENIYDFSKENIEKLEIEFVLLDRKSGEIVVKSESFDIIEKKAGCSLDIPD